MENLKELRSLRAEQVEQAEKAVAEEKPEEAQDALEEIKKLDERITAVEEEIKELTDKEKGSKEDEPKKEDAPVADKGEQRSMNQFKPSIKENKESKEFRGFMDYVKTKGAERRDVTSIEADVIIPKEIATKTVEIPNTVVDLREFTQQVKVNSGSGSYPILNPSEDVMSTVAELQANPKLQDPTFNEVKYSIETRRGQISVSEESLADADEDLGNLIARHIQRQVLNTTNKAIAEKMKSFPTKEISNLDDIKSIINQEIDPAFDLVLVVTQSMYQYLDTLKDKNGIYLLKQDITAESGTSLFGRPVHIIKDELFGAKGEAHMFIGDKNAILFADRNAVALRWSDHPTYGQILASAIRFDTQVAIEEAGFFVTFNGDTPSTEA